MKALDLALALVLALAFAAFIGFFAGRDCAARTAVGHACVGAPGHA